MMSRPSFSQEIKSPNVSGQFYDSDPARLSLSVDHYIQSAALSPAPEDVRMIIAPHAGYVYSGPVAGYSFKSVSRKKFKTMVILAPSHFYGFDGASVWPRGGFQTPLGTVSVDEDFAKQLSAADPKFAFVAQAFEKEHSLEVEIPFLQKTFTDFKIVPVIVGDMGFETCQKLAASIAKIMGNREDVLIVISSDMSHYHPDSVARPMDLGTLKIIESLNADDLYKQCRKRRHEMCGFIPVTTALILARDLNWQAKVLNYANSGDVTGDTSRVVGYGAVMFYSSQNPVEAVKMNTALNLNQKKELLQLARRTIESFIKDHKKEEANLSDKRLNSPEGAFVTIRNHGELRGCIGHIITDEPLQKTVRDLAILSSSEDNRFWDKPILSAELPELDLEISVLSRPWRINDLSEIKMGTHGVILRRGNQGGVFLPQVATETGWTKEKFLSELCSQKAGLPGDCWKDPSTKIEIFTAQVFGENDLKD